MQMSKRWLAGLGLAGLIMESIVVQPAFAADKVSLFKVITSKDEVVIGIPDGELAKMDGNAGGIAKTLVANGSLSVWQYAVRKSASGDLEQAPLHRIGLILCEPAEGAADRRQPEITSSDAVGARTSSAPRRARLKSRIHGLECTLQDRRCGVGFAPASWHMIRKAPAPHLVSGACSDFPKRSCANIVRRMPCRLG